MWIPGLLSFGAVDLVSWGGAWESVTLTSPWMIMMPGQDQGAPTKEDSQLSPACLMWASVSQGGSWGWRM